MQDVEFDIQVIADEDADNSEDELEDDEVGTLKDVYTNAISNDFWLLLICEGIEGYDG